MVRSQAIVLSVCIAIPLLITWGALKHSHVAAINRPLYLLPLFAVSAVTFGFGASEMITMTSFVLMALSFQVMVLGAASSIFRRIWGEELRGEAVIGGDLRHSFLSFSSRLLAAILPAIAFYESSKH